MRWGSYAASQRPSALARSISRRPAGFIWPDSMSAAALAQLILDHLLRGARGVNRWSQNRSSRDFLWPSIQP